MHKTYKVALDKNGFYTGTYAIVGGVSGDIILEVNSLPPSYDLEEQKSYKYDYHEVSETILVPDMEEIEVDTDEPLLDEETGEQLTDEDGNLLWVKTIQEIHKQDEEGIYLYKEEVETRTVLGWFQDLDRYNQIKKESLIVTKQLKIKELGDECKKFIHNGVTVTTTQGEEHFSLTSEDQSNIKNAFDIVLQFNVATSYHADGEFCRDFTPEEIVNLYIEMQRHIFYHTTYVNMLNNWVREVETSNEANSIYYGVSVDSFPEHIKEKFNYNLSISDTIVSEILLKINS